MKVVFSVFLFFISLVTLAQRQCGSAEYTRLNPAVLANTPSTSTYQRDTVRDEILTIPVVIHVLYNNPTQNISDQQILSQLAVLNNDFRRMNTDAAQTPAAFRNAAADCRIMFCLAQVDPRGRPSRGIIRKYTTKSAFSLDDAVKFSAAGGDDAWDSRKYLNIWVCNLQGNTIGYASLPGSQADKDGVVIQFNTFGTTGNLQPSFNKGRTATHEVGHWLGLKHIWGDNACGSDGIEDTPPQAGYNINCPVFPRMSTCSSDASGDMFMNFMDYTNDACMNLFTHGQKKKMRGLFAVGGPRNSFMSSFACDSTLATGADLPVTVNPTTPSVDVSRPIVTAFPNPVVQTLIITASEGYTLTGKSIVLTNTNGVTLKRIQQANSDRVQLDMSSYPAGIYLIQVGVGAERQVQKIVKP
jgi:hypothetical protein